MKFELEVVVFETKNKWFHVDPQGSSSKSNLIHFLGKNFLDVNKLTSDDLFEIIEEIPSDSGSVTSEAPSDDDIVEECDYVEELPEMESTDVYESEEVISVNFEIYGALIYRLLQIVQAHHLEWDSEDERPLASWIQKQVSWIKTPYYSNPSPFEQDSGPNVPDWVETPLETFLCVFPISLLEHMVFQTNLYATQLHGERFTRTNLDEMKCFIAINLMMGITKKPSYRDYWSSKFEMRDPYISSVISRNRFGWLLGHIHLNDNSVQPKKGEHGFDKLYKLRPMLDILDKTYIDCYKPSENQSIDESMVKFKGRISFRMYMPLKPIKRGYKIWIRANDTGYVSQFQIYTGKVDKVEHNLGQRVVSDLTLPLMGKYHKVYFDNFFNGVSLQTEMLAKKIYSCGTMRKGRRNEPKNLLSDKVMKRGDSDWRMTEGGLLYLKWADNRPVLFLSNFHNPEHIDFVSRKQKDGSSHNISCLKLVRDYNKHMGYVDKSDMYISLYKVNRKSKKWWHRLMWHFVDLSVVNSYIIYKTRAVGTKNMSLKDFRIAVATGLIGAGTKQSNKRTSDGDEPNRYKKIVPLEKRYDKCAHLPEHGNKVRCAHCSTRLQPHRTRWHCTTCNVGLCLNDKFNCFRKFHQED